MLDFILALLAAIRIFFRGRSDTALVVLARRQARYLRRIRRCGDPGKRWLAFLQYHREVIEHGRRKLPHFNVTRHPTAEWVVQQLRKPPV